MSGGQVTISFVSVEGPPAGDPQEALKRNLASPTTTRPARIAWLIAGRDTPFRWAYSAFVQVVMVCLTVAALIGLSPVKLLSLKENRGRDYPRAGHPGRTRDQIGIS